MKYEDAQKRFHRRALIVVGALGLLWLAFAVLLGPQVANEIESAARGESLPWMNRIVAQVNPRSLERYSRLLMSANPMGLAAWAVCLLVTWVVTKPGFFERYVGEATPASLGGIRMLICFILLLMTLLEDLSTTALLPREMAKQVGVMQFFYQLPGFRSLLVNADALWAFQILTAVFLFLGMIGLLTRFVVPVAALCCLLLGGIVRHYGFFFHTGLLPLYVLIVLSFTPCGDGWSLDRLLRDRRGAPPPPSKAAIYGWARYACWVAIALPYMAAGLSKLRVGGSLWWTATNMRSILYTATLQPLNFDWGLTLRMTRVPDLFFSALGLMSVVAEIAFVLVLFSVTARFLLPTLMIMFHVGIIFMQNILFLDLILLQLVFFDFTRVRGFMKLFLPGVSLLGESVYGYVARRRFGLIRSDEHCPVQTSVTDFVAAGETPGAQLTLPNDRTRTFVRYSTAVTLLASLLLTCWVFRVEFFPLTSMQMFSESNHSGVIHYYKFIAHYESGAAERVYLNDVLGYEADFRYRYHISQAFDPRKTHVAEKYFIAGVAALNKKSSSASRIRKFEIQKWRWDFINDVGNPEYGHSVERITFDVGALAPSRVATAGK